MGTPAQLTLEQVRAAGITARSRDGRGEFRWMGGTTRSGEKVWWRALEKAQGADEVWTLRTDLEPPLDGWMHEQPCACTFCRPAV